MKSEKRGKGIGRGSWEGGMGRECAERLVTCSGSGGSSKQCKNAQRDSTHASKYGAPGTGVRSNSPISRPNISGPNPSVRACDS